MKVSSETRCDPVGGNAHVAAARRSLLGGFACNALVAHDGERVARGGNVGEPHHLDGNRGTGLLDLFALVVDQRAHFSERSAGDDDVADAQRAVLHQHRGDRAAAAVQRRFDHDAARAPVLVRAQLTDVGLEQHGVEEAVDAVAGLRGDGHHLDCAGPVDRRKTLLHQLLLDAVGLRVGPVDLVDRDDDWDVRGLDVRDRLFRLRHDAVVRGDDENRNVRDLRAACAHRSERFVTRRVHERDLAIVSLDRVRADLLRDAARLAGRDVCLPNLVEQGRLAVVDVTEHCDDRRARGQHLGLVLFLLDGHFFAGFLDDGVETEALSDLNRDVARNVLVDRRHRPDLDQLGDHVAHRNDHRRREFLDGEQIGNLDRLERAGRSRDGRLALLLTLPLLLEKQFLLAIFLGRGLVLVSAAIARARRPSTARASRRARRAAPARDRLPATSDGTGRCRPDGVAAAGPRARVR